MDQLSVRFRCPRCGALDTELAAVPKIQITIEPYQGTYCQICFAEWISKNMPRMEALVYGQ